MIVEEILNELNNEKYLSVEKRKLLKDNLPNCLNELYDVSKKMQLNVLKDILEILNEEGEIQCVPILIDILSKEDSSELKASLVICIGKFGETSVIPELARYLYDNDRRVRANTIEALATIGDRSIIKLLEPFLTDEDNRIRANTAMALWDFEQEREKIKKVFEDMVKDNEKWMKASAFYAFGEKKIKDFIDLLLSSLDDEDEDICRNAVIALIGYAETMELEDTDKNI